MKLSFLQFEFNLEFLKPAIVSANPLFVLRGMLGKNLRSMCCISRQSVCGECLYSKTCVYSYIFETILPSDNSVLPGRNKGCHPYSLSVKNREHKNPLTEYSFILTLFGKSVEYLPYIYTRLLSVPETTESLKAGHSSGLKALFRAEKIFLLMKIILIWKFLRRYGIPTRG